MNRKERRSLNHKVTTQLLLYSFLFFCINYLNWTGWFSCQPACKLSENNEKRTKVELYEPPFSQCVYVFSSSLFCSVRSVRRSLALIQLNLISKNSTKIQRQHSLWTNKSSNPSDVFPARLSSLSHTAPPSFHLYRYLLLLLMMIRTKFNRLWNQNERNFKCDMKLVGRYPVFFWDYYRF